MANPMRIRADVRDGVTDVRMQVPHPMESGQRKDDKGAIIPAHFITQLEVRHGERVVFSAEFGPSVSANPFLRFRFKGAAAGDRLVASWVDSRGETRSDQVQIGGAAA